MKHNIYEFSLFFEDFVFRIQRILKYPWIQMFADWSCTVLVHNRTCCVKYRISHRFQSISVTLVISVCSSLVHENHYLRWILHFLFFNIIRMYNRLFLFQLLYYYYVHNLYHYYRTRKITGLPTKYAPKKHLNRR